VYYSTYLLITQDSRMLSTSVLSLWKANNKYFTSSEFHFASTRVATVGEVRNLCSSLWVTADHSSLKRSQNTHKGSKSSEINAKRSVYSSSLTPPIFVFKFYIHNTQSPIQVSALFTPAHLTKLKQRQGERRIPPPYPSKPGHLSPCLAHEGIFPAIGSPHFYLITNLSHLWVHKPQSQLDRSKESN
jgi:hypothetical protein